MELLSLIYYFFSLEICQENFLQSLVIYSDELFQLLIYSDNFDLIAQILICLRIRVYFPSYCFLCFSYNRVFFLFEIEEACFYLVPLDFYNFRVTQDFAQNIVTSLRKNGTFKDAGPERIYAFMNTIEELPDVNCLKAVLDANNLTTSGWFSVGFDLYGIKSKNLNGDIVDAPYEKIGKWMSNSTNLPYKNRKWIALTPNETIEAFKSAF